MSESEQFSRTRLLIGDKALEKLKNSRVAVFGVGGVGGFVCEALVRSGAIDVIVVDSVAALTPKAEIDGEMGDNHVGLQDDRPQRSLASCHAPRSSSG